MDNFTLSLGGESLPLFARESLALEKEHFNYSAIHVVSLVFPDIHRFINDHVSRTIGFDIFGALFPPWTAEQCPELRYTKSLGGLETVFGTNTVTLRNPTLIPAQFLGIAVGLVGAVMLLRSAPAIFPGGKPEHTQQWSHALYWPMALFWFAMMNTTSIAAHSVFEPHTPSYQVWLKLDVMATGLSSLNFSIGSMCALRKDVSAILASTSVALAVNILLLSLFIKIGLNAWPWQSETLYLLQVVVAAAFQVTVFYTRIVRDKASGSEMFLMALQVAAAAVFAICPLVDIACCTIFGDSRVSVIQLAFLGCDWACLCLVPWLRIVRASEAR
eukprot:2739337-Rhodomonas_salina.3